MNKAESYVSIAGTGSFSPEDILTNADLEKMVDTSDEWIVSRTGMKERRIADKHTATSDMATRAAEEAIRNAGINASDIDMIITATVTPDMVFPSTSCLVQKNLGAKKAFCFDIEAACSGFIYSVEIASQFLRGGNYENALVIGAEKLTSITDFTDRNTCVLFGDAAGAAVLQRKKGPGTVLGCYLGADGEQADLLFVPAGGSRIPASQESVDKRLHYIKMEGQEVFKYAVKAMSKSVNTILKRFGVSKDAVKLVLPHQANKRIIDSLRMRLDLTEEQVFINLHKYGNISAASVPVALHEAVIEERMSPGDYVILVAFGGGFTWGSCLIKW